MARLTDIMKEEDPCWKGYQQIGMKKKGGKEVPNCVPESVNEAQKKLPKFKNIPSWAKYVAQHSDGEWFFYEEVPTMIRFKSGGGAWKQNGNQIYAGVKTDGKDWDKRPTYYYVKNGKITESVNEGHFGDIDIIANEAKDFKDFVKEFYKEYRDFPKTKDSIKWLEGIYRGRSKMEGLGNDGLERVAQGLPQTEEEPLSEVYHLVIKTKNGETFKSKKFNTKAEADSYYYKLAKTRKYKSIDYVKESINENTLSDLENRLKSHDWWYAYSDDSRKYNRGESNWSEITKMVKGMKGNKEAEKLWNKYAPKDFGYSFKKLSETQLDEGIFKIGIKHIIPLIPTGYAPNDPKYKMDLKILRTMLNNFYQERGYEKVILPSF